MFSWSDICTLSTQRNHTYVHEAGVLKSISEARKKQVSNIYITKVYVLLLSAYEKANYWIIGLEEK